MYVCVCKVCKIFQSAEKKFQAGIKSHKVSDFTRFCGGVSSDTSLAGMVGGGYTVLWEKPD